MVLYKKYKISTFIYGCKYSFKFFFISFETLLSILFFLIHFLTQIRFLNIYLTEFSRSFTFYISDSPGPGIISSFSNIVFLFFSVDKKAFYLMLNDLAK